MTGPRSAAAPRTATGVRARPRELVLVALLLCAFGLVGPAALGAGHAAGHHQGAGHGTHHGQQAVPVAAALAGAPHAGVARPDRLDHAPAVLVEAGRAPAAGGGPGTGTSSPISSSATADSPRTRGPPVDARS